ncbi:hypothetical protein PPGU19_084040 (plasmid) [Paraburkholderia sp. PGU19]|nr:hypothetical protein PPGU19_084040 [Paraburkholderia sp. PGU19]
MPSLYARRVASCSRKPASTSVAARRLTVAFGKPVRSTRSLLDSKVAPGPNARRMSIPRSSERFNELDESRRGEVVSKLDGILYQSVVVRGDTRNIALMSASYVIKD